jgi:hypothetical protein
VGPYLQGVSDLFKLKKTYLINIAIGLVCLITLALVHTFGYKGLGSTFPFLILSSWLTVNIFQLFNQKTTAEKYLFPFGLLVMIISITTFIFSLPPVSYAEAKSIAIHNGLTDLTKPPFEVVLATELPTTKKITESYLFAGKLEDRDVYLMVSPINGSIQVETVGHSYLDEALKLIEERNSK